MEPPSPESHLDGESDSASSSSEPSPVFISTDDLPTSAEGSSLPAPSAAASSPPFRSSLDWPDEWGPDDFDTGAEAGFSGDTGSDVPSGSGDSLEWEDDWGDSPGAPTTEDSSSHTQTEAIEDTDSSASKSNPTAVLSPEAPSSPSSSPCEPPPAIDSEQDSVVVVVDDDVSGHSERSEEEEEGTEGEGVKTSHSENGEPEDEKVVSSDGSGGGVADEVVSESEECEVAPESEETAAVRSDGDGDVENVVSGSDVEMDSDVTPTLNEPEPESHLDPPESASASEPASVDFAACGADDDDWDDDWGDGDDDGGMDDFGDELSFEEETTATPPPPPPPTQALPTPEEEEAPKPKPKPAPAAAPAVASKAKSPRKMSVNPISLVSQIFGDKSGISPFPRDAAHEIIQSMVYPPSEYDIWTEEATDEEDEDTSPFGVEFPAMSLVDLYFGESETASGESVAVGIADRPVQQKKKRLKDFSWSDSLMETRFLKAIGFVKSRDAGRFGQLQTPAATAAFVSSSANSPANFSRPRRSSEPTALPQAAEKLVSSEADSMEAVSPSSGPPSSVPGEILEQSEKFVERRVDESEWGEMEKELDRVQDRKEGSPQLEGASRPDAGVEPVSSSLDVSVAPDPTTEESQSSPDVAEAVPVPAPPESAPKPAQPPPPKLSPQPRGVVTFSAAPKSRKRKPKLSLRLRARVTPPDSRKKSLLREEINQFAKDETDKDEDEWSGMDGFDDVSQDFGSFDDEDDGAFPDDDEFALDSTGVLPPPPAAEETPPPDLSDETTTHVSSPIVIPPSPKSVEGGFLPTEIEIEPEIQEPPDVPTESTTDDMGGFDLSAFVPSVSPVPLTVEKAETSFLDDFLGGGVDDVQVDLDDQVREILDLIPDLSRLK